MVDAVVDEAPKERADSRRKRLRLVYFDGQQPRLLDLAEALSLVAP